MSGPRKIWANVAVESNGTGLCGEWNHCDVGSTEDTLYHRDDVVRELIDALKECRDELDAYSRQEYPSDHPVHERYRKRDFDANPARIALAKIAQENGQ